MAFRDGLSRTQQILLAICYFPLQPFSLCYRCFARRKEDKEKPDTLAHVEEGKEKKTDRQPKFKDVRVFPSLTVQDNEGFQVHGKQGPRLPEEHNLYAYPWDKSTLKSMPIDLQQFEILEAYVAKVNVQSSVENMVSALLQEAHNDLEKVRAIWIWICHHIEYDVEFLKNSSSEYKCKPADVFRSKKSICAGYAAIFEDMCSIAGIQCKTLSGYAKGGSYKTGDVFRGDTNHAWNAVFLQGRWHLLDCTWGSGTVDHSCYKFTFRYNEFYFLTHPALFIADHFQEDHKWQLLKPRLTLKQFEKNVYCRSGFYSEGLVAVSPETGVIQTENGKATIFVESRSPALFLFKLNEAKENCLMTLQRNGMKLEVYPQQTGTHCLQIYAKHFNDKKENYSHVLEYSLKCSSVDKSISLPRGLIQPVGPSWLTEQAGITKVLPPGPIIHTEDGRCVVTFIQTKDLDVFATLESDNSRFPDNTMRRHIWKTFRGNQAELKIHLPHVGHFALLIWAKKASDPGNHQCALSYLLSCPNKSVTWPVFPQSYTNWKDDYELLAPIAGILPANCQVQFKLKLPGVFKASIECGGKTLPLTLSEAGFWEGACNTSGGTEVTVRMPMILSGLC